jgi:sugar transferase (PEP-CTERM/EpsH1 system associated)
MRIVQVAESLDFGGAERVVVDLSNALARNHEVSVVCVKRVGELASQLSPGVQVQCLNKPEGTDLRLPLRLARLFENRRADVVHIHHWGVFLEATFAASRAGVQTILHTAHGKYPQGSGVKQALRHWLERRASGRCKRVVCVSDALLAYVVEEIGLRPELLQTIVNGIDVAELREPRNARGQEEFVFVAVGRLAAVKNYPLMLEAFAEASARAGQLRLLIAGDGPERGTIEALVAERRLESKVRLLGFTQDVNSVLKNADAYVISSLSEGTPMAVLEAMRAGLPVLATRVGGLPTVIREGETGLLVPSGDVTALSRAMVELASDPGRSRAMGDAGYRHVLGHFSLRSMVAAYENLYANGRAA